MDNFRDYCFILSLFVLVSGARVAAAPDWIIKVDSASAVVTLLTEAKRHFEMGENEQAAAKLERALRIEPRNPVLWHNLAGVRLQQEDWHRAGNLAAKSNALAVHNTWLRVRNWIVIALACEGMNDMECAIEARKRAQTLAR